MEIFEAGHVIGTMEVRPEGLFWEITCKITEKPEELRRIFVQEGWKTEYLGIPDRRGALSCRLPQKRLPEGISWGIAGRHPKNEWLPWRGELRGVQIETAFIKPTERGIDLALCPEQAYEFPAWAEDIKIERVLDREMGILPLSPEGYLPMKEIEIGGTTNEEMDRGNFDFELSDDAAADDGIGIEPADQEQGREADCSDL